LASDEEEVEDLWVVEQIEEILQKKYEMKARGPGEGTKGRTPIHVSVSVEPLNLCVANTP
jgi:hypothetical protein